jgi:hypothetical protein
LYAAQRVYEGIFRPGGFNIDSNRLIMAKGVWAA